MGKQLMIASGHHFNLSCEAEGTPPPRISWFKDGSRITSISTEHGRRTSVMSFMPVRPENQGRYWCEAKSTEGWTQSPSVFLKGIKKEKEITDNLEHVFEMSELEFYFIFLTFLCNRSFEEAIFCHTSWRCFSLRGRERHYVLSRDRFPGTSDWLVEKQWVDRQVLLCWRKLILGFQFLRKTGHQFQVQMRRQQLFGQNILFRSDIDSINSTNYKR